MKQAERDEIRQLPAKYRPLTAWAYFGYSLLFSLPVAGLILLIVFSISSANINRRSFARSFFCVYIIGAVIFLIMLFTGGVAYLYEALFVNR